MTAATLTPPVGRRLFGISFVNEDWNKGEGHGARNRGDRGDRGLGTRDRGRDMDRVQRMRAIVSPTARGLRVAACPLFQYSFTLQRICRRVAYRQGV